jgi:hypothetical protein
VVARQGRGRTAPTGGIEHYGHGHGDLLPIAQRTVPPLYQHRRAAATTSQTRARSALAKRKPTVNTQGARGSSTAGANSVPAEMLAKAARGHWKRRAANFLARVGQAGCPRGPVRKRLPTWV